MIKREFPDMSQVKPPTRTGAETMILNLRAAAGTKADNSPEQIEPKNDI